MSCEIQYKNFKIAIQSWIDCLKHQLSMTDKNEDPISYKRIEIDLKESQSMLYNLSGAKSKEFKDLLCTQ